MNIGQNVMILFMQMLFGSQIMQWQCINMFPFSNDGALELLIGCIYQLQNLSD